MCRQQLWRLSLEAELLFITRISKINKETELLLILTRTRLKGKYEIMHFVYSTHFYREAVRVCVCVCERLRETV